MPRICELGCARIHPVSLKNIRLYNGHLVAEVPVPGNDRCHVINDWRRETITAGAILEEASSIVEKLQQEGLLVDKVRSTLEERLQNLRAQFERAFFSNAAVTITGYLNNQGEATSPPWLTFNPPRGNVPEAQIFFVSGPYSSGNRWFVHRRGHPGQFRWFHTEETIIRHGANGNTTTTRGLFHVFVIGTDSEPAIVEMPTKDGPKFMVILSDRILEEETPEEVQPYLLQGSSPDSTGSIGKVVAAAGPEPEPEELSAEQPEAKAVAPAALDLTADPGKETLEGKRPCPQEQKPDFEEPRLGGNGNGHKGCGGTRRQIQNVAIAAALAEA